MRRDEQSPRWHSFRRVLRLSRRRRQIHTHTHTVIRHVILNEKDDLLLGGCDWCVRLVCATTFSREMTNTANTQSRSNWDIYQHRTYRGILGRPKLSPISLPRDKDREREIGDYVTFNKNPVFTICFERSVSANKNRYTMLAIVGWNKSVKWT